MKGQGTDQKSNGRIHKTNTLQAVTVCPELHAP